ncbi:helix-turn-helix domain-containing protein [Novosphingobium sp.]|uniref:helix-turn-helix domain-containing protein n=1 Tax=Novosphingobium sp. TaxID=1874826 RepID=UPI0025F14985|nr:helix-turn-helix domain-containing protein [Novosphingobium sp.]MCC6926313.1 DUF4115 domain-containing protein [Novosphingobium sp.]
MVEQEEAAAEAELPLESVGSRLRRAREEAGLSLPQLAAETRISVRQLTALETGDYSALSGRTYAIGFSRTYAKAVGLNDAEIAAAVRAELAEQAPAEPRRTIQTFEPGDPGRVPSVRLAWIAAALLLAAVVAGITFLPGVFAPGGSLPSILPADEPSPTMSAAPAAQPAPVPSGPVVFTALEPAVWVKFTDAAGNQLFQKELAQNESFTVPTDKGEVFLRTAKPNALGITIGGQAVTKIAEEQKTVASVPVSAAALLARGTAQALPTPQPSASAAAAPAARQPERRRTQRSSAPQAETVPSAAASSAPSVPAPAPAAPVPAPSAT